MKLDGLFTKVDSPCAFSKEDALKSVAEFVVCDDQYLAVASKSTFRNCLVAMKPTAANADLPSMHDISTYVHNSFIEFLRTLKSDLWVT
ncbi:hypothetical protein BS17DRAFT_713667 [Gyrodon lividus]|nr:hypothetical protein BS17DRAFT_713667 [Gyrodon lividus]